jgi:signal transduction histidine kinase
VKSWPRKQWRDLVASYDADEAVAGSHPVAIAIAAGSLGAVLLAIGYVPALARGAQLERPWIALLLTALGAAVTYLAYRERCRGVVGTLATLGDNGLYSAALTYAAVNAQGGYGTGLAIAHGLMVLALPAQTYGLTLPFALVMALPPVFGLALFEPTETVTVIVVTTYLLALLLSFLTRRRRDLLQAQATLTQAVGAASQVADESIQAALATTLLSLGHFLHELKNQQTAVRSNLAYVATCEALDDDYREALREALDAQEAEQRLVHETIESLKQRARPAHDPSFSLGELLESTAAQAQGVVVAIDSNERRFAVQGAHGHLRAVLQNLLRNADQAGASRVHLAARLEASGQAVQLVVHDDGEGIPNELRDRLFEPFGGTTKREGTGLGLYLCRRYVELLGGSIEAGDGPLGGAAFTIRLPGRVVAANASTSKSPDEPLTA